VIFTQHIREQIDEIAERAAAAVVASGDVAFKAQLDSAIALPVHISLLLHAGEWFIVDEKGDLLKIHGDRQRIVDVCLKMRTWGVL
jgi:hypothetical protein